MMGLEGIHPQPLKFIVGFAQYDRPTLPWLTQHADTERLLRRYCNFTTPVRYCHCARKLAAIGVLVRDVEAIDRGPATSPRSGDLLVTLVASVVVLLSLWTLSVGGYPYCSPPGAVIPGCTSSG